MPVVWYLLWAGIVVGLGFAFRPDQSPWWFYLWDVTILVLRGLLFVSYILYYLNTMTADLFPFYYFSHKWRMSSPRLHRPLTEHARRHHHHRKSRLLIHLDRLLVYNTERRKRRRGRRNRRGLEERLENRSQENGKCLFCRRTDHRIDGIVD